MVTLRILGPIELEGGRDPDELLRHPRDLAVLAYVTVMGGASGQCTRDQLSAVFWSESDEKRSRNALNQALHRIRRATDDDVITVLGQGLRLDPQRIDTDVDRFRDLMKIGGTEAALALYRGDLLSGLHIPRPGPFEDWLEQERVRLRGVARSAARRLRDEAAGRGSLEAALRFARRSREISNREEEDVRRLIEMLVQSGDRVAALREYEHFARWLESDLEIQPSRETKDLIASVTAEGAHSERVDRRGAVGEPASSPPPPNLSVDVEPKSRSAPWRRHSGWAVGSAAVLATVGLVLTSPRKPGSARALGLSPEAWAYYEQGEAYVRTGNGGDQEANWRLSLEMFQRASELSPRSAAAHAAVGVAHLRLFHFGFDRSTERQVMAKRAIDQGSRLDPGDPEVNRALGWYYEWGERDYTRALEAGQRVLEILPEDVGALTLVFAASRRLGRASEALPVAQELVRVNGGAGSRMEWAATLIGLREYERALEVLDEALALFPIRGGLHYRKWLTTLLSTGDLASSARVLEEAQARMGHEATWPWEFGQLWLSRQYEDALGVLERERPETFSTQQGEFPVDLMFGLVESLAGDERAARGSYARSVERLQEMSLARPDEPWVHGWLAVALAGTGDKAAALAQIDAARALADLEPDLWENPYMMQEVILPAYIQAGEYDKAIELLAELLDSRHYRAISREWIRMDPRFDPLRAHPQWPAVSGDDGATLTEASGLRLSDPSAVGLQEGGWVE